MLEGGTEREVVSLLELYNLNSHLARLEDNPNNLDTLTQVLLDAYAKTKVGKFFGLFYEVTYPVHFSWAKSYLNRLNSPLYPDDVVAEAYTKILNLCLYNKIANIQNPSGYINRMIRNLTSQANSTHQINIQPLGASDRYTPESKAKPPIDILIRLEEEDRKERQFSFIQELLLGRHEGLTEGDREIFVDFYINKKTAKNIALQRSTSMYNINKVLYRLKKKIKRLSRSCISLAKREEEV